MTYIVGNGQSKVASLLANHFLCLGVYWGDVHLMEFVDYRSLFTWLESEKHDFFVNCLHKVLLIPISCGHQENFYSFRGSNLGRRIKLDFQTLNFSSFWQSCQIRCITLDVSDRWPIVEIELTMWTFIVFTVAISGNLFRFPATIGA